MSKTKTPNEFTATLNRNPLKLKSDDWQETAHHWLVTINGHLFDYYTGFAHRVSTDKGSTRHDANAYDRIKNLNLKDTADNLALLLKRSKPTPPTLDDVLHCLVMDAEAASMTFQDWCGNLGYDEDSRKALSIYHECQETYNKLVQAGIDIDVERERLQDY